MPSYQDLIANAEASKRRIDAADRPRIAVCVDTSSIAVGAIETLAAIQDAVQGAGIEANVDRVGGNGLSFANPVVEVARPDGARVLFQHVKAEDAAEFVQTVIGRGELSNRWTLGALAGEPAGVPAMESHSWWAVQTRRLMSEMGRIDPENVDDSLAYGAYSGLERAMSMTQEDVIAEVIDSTLGGRRRFLLSHGPQVGLSPHVTDEPQEHRLQRRRGRPGRLGKPHDHGVRPSRAAGRHDDRRLGDRRRERLRLHS